MEGNNRYFSNESQRRRREGGEGGKRDGRGSGESGKEKISGHLTSNLRWEVDFFLSSSLRVKQTLTFIEETENVC
jgi:hypothetical protein